MIGPKTLKNKVCPRGLVVAFEALKMTFSGSFRTCHAIKHPARKICIFIGEQGKHRKVVFPCPLVFPFDIK